MKPWTRCCGRERRAWTPSNRWRGGAGCQRGRSMRNCCGIGRSALRVLIGLLVAAAVCPAQDYVDKVVERARKEFEVPGIAVAIVKDGNVVLAKGYGVRKLGEAAPVTAHSLFRIA